MPRFTVVPADPHFASAEIVAQDAGPALHVISQTKCGEADILEDGRYAFSLRLGTSGVWCLFRRDDENSASAHRSDSLAPPDRQAG